MLRLRILRTLGLLTVFSALSLPAVAQATTGTGHQNPRLAVSVSLSPDTASNGDVVTASETVRNTTSAKRVVTVSNTLTTPDGATFVRTSKVTLKPHGTFTQTRTYTVDPADPRGTYSLRLDATIQTGTSSATATVTYV